MTPAKARSTPSEHAWLASLAPWSASSARFVAFFAASIAVPLAIAQAPALSPVSATRPAARPAKVNPKDGLTYLLIPPGRFMMGCSPGDEECFDEEKRSHEVTITSGFWMGRTDVTQEAYQRVMGRNPSHFKGASLPVDTVSWSDAQAYCQKVGARLPTEAEWEYAARGSDPSSRYGPPGDIGWHRGNSQRKTHAVAQKKANPYGLYDMLGNVWQWTADWYGDYAFTPASDPAGPAGGTGRALRGGSWADNSRFLRESEREGALPGDRYDVIGFRCVSAFAPEDRDLSAGFVPEDRAVPAGGASESLDFTFPPDFAWKASSSADWITFTGPTSGVGKGTLRYLVASNAGPGRAATIAVAGASFTVEQEAGSIPGLSFIGCMPHIAAGQDWKTTFALIDKDSAPAQVRLSLIGDSGSPLKLPVTFPQQPSTRGPLIGASLDRTLSSNASLIIDTAGAQTGPIQAGSAQLAATGSVDGFAILHLIPGGQETAVRLETRNAGSYLLAFDNTAGVGFSVALANTSAQAANVGVVIRDATGAQIGNGSLALESGGHTAFLLSTQYPVTANKQGTIEFDTPPGGRIGALGIRTTPLGTTHTLTAIPALANIGTGGGSIPHTATGNGWQSTFVLINTGRSAARASLAFFDDRGNPLSLPIEFPQLGGAASVVSSVNQTLAAGATLLVQSAAPLTNPAPTIGSAQLSTDGNVGGFEILRYNPSGQEAVVPIESRNAHAYLLAFDNSNGTATGVAINSTSTQAASIPVVVRDDTGAQIATDTIPLAANGHLAFTLAVDKYPAAANIRGTIEFDTPAGARIGVLGIRIPVAHTFTTLPALVK
jgi:formylglycine-generating enzyme required for sulfatase activity